MTTSQGRSSSPARARVGEIQIWPTLPLRAKRLSLTRWGGGGMTDTNMGICYAFNLWSNGMQHSRKAYDGPFPLVIVFKIPSRFGG